jgi:hypothetical protein
MRLSALGTAHSCSEPTSGDVPVPLPLPNALDVVDGSAADVELAETASEFEESACGATAVSTGTDADALVVEVEDVLVVEVPPDDVPDVLEPNDAPVLPIATVPAPVMPVALEPVAAVPVALVADVVVRPALVPALVAEPPVLADEPPGPVAPAVVAPLLVDDVAPPDVDVPDVEDVPYDDVEGDDIDAGDAVGAGEDGDDVVADDGS